MENNYTVLARKYRSQDFESLIGQDVLVKTLTTAINTGRIAHAYIFTGIRGTGKTSTARILAKALNCLSSDHATSKPCGKCENCLAIAAGQHIDVMEIDAASHTGVDNMREILDAALYRPTNARYKVYIIDEVHMLSTSAFNALLKTLEEPPAHVIFILATTEIRKVPVTILSRCQRFDLARVPVETLKKHFAWIAEQEKIELSDGANELLARAADGSVRDGLSLLDQAIAQTGGHVDEASVLDMLKRTDCGTVVNFMQTVLSGDVNAALNKLDEIYNNGADLTMLLNDMMEWTHWATRMYPSLRLQDATSSPYTADQRETIKKINEKISLNTLSRIWQVMIASVPELQASGNQKQCFDMLIVRLMHIADMPSIPELLKQQDKEVVQQKPAEQPKPVVEEKKFIEIKTSADLANALQQARELLLYSYYSSNLEIAEFTDGHIKYFDRKDDKEFSKKLAIWLKEKTGKLWNLEKLEQSTNQETISEHAKSEITSDPMVASAMDLFKDAEIVNISK
ncbi:MAG: DNA polymerase III subunit gamma/tau [Alphaproteobacteria bacterium]|nr:DNA polymerase III subunit gamma/tau [Alphaproteobacteria bacterium]